ncbi:MAG: hypothetical protein R2792_18405 [Saprospiraceae bacterium]
MRILIISPHFAPLENPRAHRWTALAQYWAAQGHEVQVICAKHGQLPGKEIAEGVAIHRCGYFSTADWSLSFFSKPKQSHSTSVKSGFLIKILDWFYQHIWKNRVFPDDSGLWVSRAHTKAQELLQSGVPDLLITVSMPFAAHLVGEKLCHQHPELSWLVDIGDPLLHPKRLEAGIQLENKTFQFASRICVTCTATKRYYVTRPFSPKVFVVPPLLYPEDGFEEEPRIAGESLHIGYFGALYFPYRSPAALLQLLDRANKRLKRTVVFHWYGPIKPEMEPYFKNVPNVVLHGNVDRKTARRAMMQMDALVHIGNRSSIQLPSKFVDYLASGKAVLHLQYVEDDPFVESWGESAGLHTIFVEEEGTGAEVQNRFFDWLRSLPQPVQKRNPEALEHFRIQSVSNHYLMQ